MLSYGILVPDFVVIKGEGLMIERNGCRIQLQEWYLFAAVLIWIKFLVESVRYYSFWRQNHENILAHVGGNLIILPTLFIIFFALT